MRCSVPVSYTHLDVYKRQDVGFAYDGDADRCIAVDHRGNIIDGDKIMYVCGKYLREQGRLNGNTVVTLSLIHISPLCCFPMLLPVF